MLDIICCNHETHKIVNTERIWGARNEGATEKDAQAHGLMGYYCEFCHNWHKESEGQLLRYDYLTNTEAWYPIGNIGCLVFETEDE